MAWRFDAHGLLSWVNGAWCVHPHDAGVVTDAIARSRHARETTECTIRVRECKHTSAPYREALWRFAPEGGHGATVALGIDLHDPLLDLVSAITGWFGDICAQAPKRPATSDGAELALTRELYERERRIAETFQTAVLPRSLPTVPHVRFDALYQPGRSESLVGGDWFDAFCLRDGRIVITIGDVVGSGLAAATAMAAIRQSIRGAAAVNADPVVLLDAADRIVADDGDGFATAWVGLLGPRDLTLVYASAGHPPPLVRAPDGEISELAAEGLPLGLASEFGVGRSEGVLQLRAGSLLALYTDGLIENERDALAGNARLWRAVADLTPTDATARDLCDTVIGEGPLRDDVAILLVSVSRPVSED